ncbi:MAG: Crp/Fnr family transcriptional regulator [Bryobacterales bacterium]|nr:Crp/Fnr family transcriptional regulator [Bryobacterales bacterium]
MQAHQLFSSIDLFHGLPDEEVQALVGIAISKRYQAGEHIFFEGDACTGLWILAEGAAKVVKMTPAGRQIVLATQHAPSSVAEVPVFDGGPYPASLTAMETCTALLLRKEDFLQLCRRNPDLTLKFLAIFGARLRHLVNLVERITFGSIRQRLAQELLNFAGESDSERFLLPETHEELATRLGTVREVVSRNLSRFQAEGMLRIQRREVEILGRDALLAEANTEM